MSHNVPICPKCKRKMDYLRSEESENVIEHIYHCNKVDCTYNFNKIVVEYKKDYSY